MLREVPREVWDPKSNLLTFCSYSGFRCSTSPWNQCRRVLEGTNDLAILPRAADASLAVIEQYKGCRRMPASSEYFHWMLYLPSAKTAASNMLLQSIARIPILRLSSCSTSTLKKAVLRNLKMVSSRAHGCFDDSWFALLLLACQDSRMSAAHLCR